MLLQPLIRAVNGPNSAISLKQTFNRIFVTGNILEYKKQKNGDRGTIVYSAALITREKTAIIETGVLRVVGWLVCCLLFGADVIDGAQQCCSVL